MMKQKLLFLAVALMMLTACQNSNEDTQPAEGEGRITFQVINYQQYSLDDETTRANPLPADTVPHLDMAIYSAISNELVTNIHQNKGDNGYGSFSAVLPYGTYNVVLLGYEGTRVADVSNIEQICFADNFVPNFFYKRLQVTIDKPEVEAQNVSLTRRIGAFKFISRGINPVDLDSLMVEAQGGSHHFNALTGNGAIKESRSYKYGVSKRAGEDSLSITFYSFLLTEETTMEFKVTAFDASKDVIQSKDFKNVPMCINQRTQYDGKFFVDEQSLAGYKITIDGDKWDKKEYTY